MIILDDVYARQGESPGNGGQLRGRTALRFQGAAGQCACARAGEAAQALDAKARTGEIRRHRRTQVDVDQFNVRLPVESAMTTRCSPGASGVIESTRPA